MKNQLLKPLCFAMLLGIIILPEAFAQKKKNKVNTASVNYDESLYNKIEYRLVGPFRGGRSGTVTGVPGDPNLYYFGSTGGGVWKTMDGGNTYENISLFT